MDITAVNRTPQMAAAPVDAVQGMTLVQNVFARSTSAVVSDSQQNSPGAGRPIGGVMPAPRGLGRIAEIAAPSKPTTVAMRPIPSTSIGPHGTWPPPLLAAAIEASTSGTAT